MTLCEFDSYMCYITLKAVQRHSIPLITANGQICNFSIYFGRNQDRLSFWNTQLTTKLSLEDCYKTTYSYPNNSKSVFNFTNSWEQLFFVETHFCMCHVLGAQQMPFLQRFVIHMAQRKIRFLNFDFKPLNVTEKKQ